MLKLLVIQLGMQVSLTQDELVFIEQGKHASRDLMHYFFYFLKYVRVRGDIEIWSII